MLSFVALTPKPLPAQSYSATYTWNLNADGNWDNNANWTPTPTGDYAGGVNTLVQFGNVITANRTVTLNPAPYGYFFGGIQFTGSSPANAGYTLTGAQLIMNNSGQNSVIRNDRTGTADMVIRNNILLQNALDLVNTNSGGGLLRLTGAISNGGQGINIGQLNGPTVYTVELTGANTYSGPTTIYGGTLRANDGIGLSTASNLNFVSGTLQAIGATTFTRALGTGAGQVRWNGEGGFAAYNGTMTVRLNGGAGQVIGGFPGVSSLVLNSSTSNAMTDFQNGVNGNGNTFSVRVNENPYNAASDFGRMSGVLTNMGLTKSGLGTLELTAANTYTGATTVGGGGALRAVDGVGIPLASNLRLGGGVNGYGVFESLGTATFTRGLGTGAGQVQINGGGFSAYNGTLTVTLGGTTNPVTMGSTYLTGPLRFGSFTSNGRVDFRNDINLNGGSQIFTVDTSDSNSDGSLPYAITPTVAQLSGVLSNGSVRKTGLGVLELTAANTYGGATSVEDGTLRGVDGVGLPTSSNLTFTGGQTFRNVFESSGVFSRNLGTGPGEVSWSSSFVSGGFAARGGPLTIQFGGGTGSITPGAGVLGNNLTFGSFTADDVVDLRNDIGFGDYATFHVNDNPAASSDLARLSGVLSGNTALINKTGPGTLELSGTGPNTFTTTTFRHTNGTLLLNKTGAAGAATNTIQLWASGQRTSLLAGANTTVDQGVELQPYNVAKDRRIGGAADAPATFSGAINLNPTGSASAVASLALVSSASTAANATTFFGPISGAGSIVVSSGFVRFSGTNTYTRGTTVSGSHLLLDYTAGTGTRLPTAGGLTLAGGTVSVLAGADAYTQFVNGLTVNPGLSTLSNTSGSVLLDFRGSSGTGTLTLNGGLVDFQLGGGGIALPGMAGRLGNWATVGADWAALDAGNKVVAFTNYTNTFGTGEATSVGAGTTNVSTATTDSLRVDGGGGAATVAVANGATLTVTSGGILVPTTATGTTEITGGSVTTTAPTLTIAQAGTGGLTVGSAITDGGSSVGLTKSGAGDANLTGTNTFTGAVQVNGGRLRVNGTNSGGGTTTVNDGGTLGGAGTITGAVVVNDGGTMSPANSPGTLNVGTTTYRSGSTLLIELAAASTDPNATGTSDFLNVTGTLTFDPGSLISVDVDNNYVPGGVSSFQVGTTYKYKIANASGGISGDLTQVAVSSDYGGLATFVLTQIGSSLQLDFTPTSLQPVPEPGAVLSVAAAGLGLAGWVRRRRTLTGCSTPPARP